MRLMLKKGILLLIFYPLFGIISHIADFRSISVTHLFRNFMAKTSKPSYLTAKNQINKVSKEELKKALSEVKEKNLEIRRSFKLDNEAMSLRAGR